MQTREVPVPGPGQLLLRTRAAAINPSDWKMQATKTMQQVPLILGSDVAGTIEAVGAEIGDVPHACTFSINDRVLAFAGGAWSGKLDEGAFQTHVLVPASSATHIPSKLSFEQAATLPMASATAASALWRTLALPRPTSDATQKMDRNTWTADPSRHNVGVLVFGASAAVGLLAVQLARASGLTVFAIASERHRRYVCSLGAQYFVDREDVDLEQSIASAVKKAGLRTTLCLGFDAVSTRQSLIASVKILSRCSTNARLATTLHWPSDLPTPSNVTVERTSASLFHLQEEESRWLFNDYLRKALLSGLVKPAPPVYVCAGGLEGVQDALDKSRQGVSCVKLVVSV